MSTTSFDPIVGEEKPPRWPWSVFGRRVTLSPGQALVIRYRDLRLAVVGAGQVAPTLPELAWAGITTIYRVDTAEHVLCAESHVPCRGELGRFYARVDIPCRVADPAAVVGRGLRDALGVVGPPALRIVRSVGASHRFHQRQQAEDALNAALNRADFAGALDPAFAVHDLVVWLELDPEARYHIARELYAALIKDGVDALFAERMAQRPGDIEAVTALLQEAQQRKWDNSYRIMMELHDKGVVEDQHIRPVVEQLIGILGSRAITGNEAGPQAHAPLGLPDASG